MKLSRLHIMLRSFKFLLPISKSLDKKFFGFINDLKTFKVSLAILSFIELFKDSKIFRYNSYTTWICGLKCERAA